jgi:hypothetical protein
VLGLADVLKVPGSHSVVFPLAAQWVALNPPDAFINCSDVGCVPSLATIIASGRSFIRRTLVYLQIIRYVR